MLTVFIRPSSSWGRVLYSGPCDALEVGCSDGELRFSALADRKVASQLRITTPSGVFRPFSVTSTAGTVGRCAASYGHSNGTESEISAPDTGDPVSSVGHRRKADSGPASDLQNSTDPESYVTNCDAETLHSKFYALTIQNPRSNLPSVTDPCPNLPAVTDPCPNLSAVADSCSNLPSVTENPCPDLPPVTDLCSNLPSGTDLCLNHSSVSDVGGPISDLHFSPDPTSCEIETSMSVLGASTTSGPCSKLSLKTGIGAPSADVAISPDFERDALKGTLTSEFSALKIFEADLPNVPSYPLCSNAGLSFSLAPLSLTNVLQDGVMRAAQGREPVTSRSCPPTMKQFLEHRLVKRDTPLHAFCSTCGRTLLPDPIRFERVEQCCEGLTSELSENFFCHPCPAIPARDRTSQPPSLFYDTTCFYLHDSTCEEMSLAGDGRCHGCGCGLSWGRRTVAGFRPFFCDRIEFRCGGADVGEQLPYWFDVVWVSLWSMIRSAFEISPSVCRLYLHSKDSSGEETCLLLWVYHEKEPFFLVRGSGDHEVPFQPLEAHPVRYLLCPPSSPQVRSWRHDFDVDFFRVSDHALRLLVECLKMTTTCCCCLKATTTCYSKESSPCCTRAPATCSKDESTCCSREGNTCCTKGKSTCCFKEKTTSQTGSVYCSNVTCSCSKETTVCCSKDGGTCCSKEGSTCCSKETSSRFSKEGGTCSSKEASSRCSKETSSHCSKAMSSRCSKETSSHCCKETSSHCSKDKSFCCSKEGGTCSSEKMSSRFSKDGDTCFSKDEDGFRSALLPASLRGTRAFFNKG